MGICDSQSYSDYNYNQVKIDGKIKEITMMYKIGNENKIKIFDSTFVSNNKDKCSIKIDGIKKELSEYIELTNEQKLKKTIEIKLTGIENVTDMSYMFFECSSLNDLPDISKWNTQNLTNMSCMFWGCSSLKELNLSNFNTNNVGNMGFMFCGCLSLKYI